MELTILCIAAQIFTAIASPVWNSESLHACPKIPAQKNLLLEHVAGDWRMAYLFLNQIDEGVDEDNTCVVTALVPNNDSQMELSLFVDSLRKDHVDRSIMQFNADLVSPGEWKVHAPLSSAGYIHARVIRATNDHMVVTFCGPSQEKTPDNKIDDEKEASQELPLDWRTLFEETRRKKRSLDSFHDRETHMWTAVFVKHNDVSALKFVEYAAVLMKHGYDVTQGQLVSFGKCPIQRPHGSKSPL